MDIKIGEAITIIKDKIAEHFGERIESVAIGSPFAKNIKTPAIIIDIERIEEGEDKGEELTPYEVSFAAYTVLKDSTPVVELEIINFTTELFKMIRQNNFGLGKTSIPENLTSVPVEFKPANYGHKAWETTWQQTIRLGVSVWNEDGFITPTPTMTWCPIANESVVNIKSEVTKLLSIFN